MLNFTNKYGLQETSPSGKCIYDPANNYRMGNRLQLTTEQRVK